MAQDFRNVLKSATGTVVVPVLVAGDYDNIDFSTAYYDYDNMANTYATSESQELLYHTGISVNIDYDNSCSGASVVGVYPSAEYALENFFLYDAMEGILLGDHTDMKKLKAELQDEIGGMLPK